MNAATEKMVVVPGVARLLSKGSDFGVGNEPEVGLSRTRPVTGELTSESPT